MIEIKSVNLEVNKDTIRKYKSHVPSELIEIWEKYGYGEMLDGYLRFINPDDYTNLVDETCMYRQKSIPIITTAFGDVITIFNGKYIDIIKYTPSQRILVRIIHTHTIPSLKISVYSVLWAI